MRWIPAILMVMTALAGCSDAGGGGSDAGPSGTKAAAEAPIWAVGDWWSVSDTMDRTYTVAVAQDEGSDWLMLSNELSVALADHSFDISYLGNVRKSDLAGQQGSDRPAYFEWPLTHNKTWTTRWDGAQRTLVAHAMEDGRFHIQGRDSGALAVEYVYNPQIKWLDSLTFYNVTGDGEVQYGWDRDGAGEGFTGTLYRYTAVDERFTLAHAGPGPAQGSFSTSDEQELVIDFEYSCGTTPGQLLVGVMPPDENGEMQNLPPAPFVNEPAWGIDLACPGGGSDAGQVVLENIPGTWRADGLVGNTDGSFRIAVTMRTYEALSF